MPWLGLFILRLMMGERFRNATPTELRWYSGCFAFMPIWGALFVYIGHSFLERAGAIGIFGYMMGFILGGFLWLGLWARFVSSNVSWWIGGVVWLITLWLAFTGRLT
ncbi:MAG TPA: hypothetical protein VN887_04050 [Candidatus Angelobacter sp.]|nr:hypothetical protein [Candidatus Angelobacter sp.]